MITRVQLKIDWADQLWAKFPLISIQISHLRQLQKLEIIIVDQGDPKQHEPFPDKNRNQPIITRHGSGKGMKREGSLAEAMLKAEKRMFKDLAEGMRSLRTFKLIGFRDPVFAKKLEFGVLEDDM